MQAKATRRCATSTRAAYRDTATFRELERWTSGDAGARFGVAPPTPTTAEAVPPPCITAAFIADLWRLTVGGIGGRGGQQSAAKDVVRNPHERRRGAARLVTASAVTTNPPEPLSAPCVMRQCLSWGPADAPRDTCGRRTSTLPPSRIHALAMRWRAAGARQRAHEGTSC